MPILDKSVSTVFQCVWLRFPWFGLVLKLHPAPIPFLLFLPFSSSQVSRPQPPFGASTPTQAKRSIILVNGDLRCWQSGCKRSIDNDDSVVGVGARSGVWTWERDSVSGFSANEIGARPMRLKQSRRADNLQCVFFNAAALCCFPALAWRFLYSRYQFCSVGGLQSHSAMNLFPGIKRSATI